MLFVQRRTGRYGRPFNFFKFRSMSYSPQHVEVHRQYVRQYANGDEGAEATNGVHKPLNSGLVITRVGKVLRQTSLDELPQLWNVLLGNMSLVGPRPPIPYEVDLYQPHHHDRLRTIPGLTGWWQVKGRSATSFEEMVRMDVEYIQQQSLWLDIKIIVMTVTAAMNGKGAR